MDSPFNCLLFDLDDTLYPSSTGIAQGIKKNIDDFLIEKCGMSVTKASNLRVELFKTYGSTLAGLRALGYDIDADDYHDFVHGRLSYDVIKPDSQLRSLLRSITQRKIIFTNSDRVHAVKNRSVSFSSRRRMPSKLLFTSHVLIPHAPYF